VVLSRPFERPQLGENILAFLRAMGPVLHPSVGERWDDVVPKLTNYLKGAHTWAGNRACACACC
jgi:hypothetical protein